MTIFQFALTLILLALMSINSLAQQIVDGFYQNQNQEFVSIKSDSIAFRISNRTSLNSYATLVGTYKQKGKKLVCTTDTSINRLRSRLVTSNIEKDSLIIEFLYPEKHPIPFIYVQLSLNLPDGTLLSKDLIANENGQIILEKNDFKEWVSKKVVVKAFALSYQPVEEFNFEFGKKYTIHSLEHPNVALYIFSKGTKLVIQKADVENLVVILPKTSPFYLFNFKGHFYKVFKRKKRRQYTHYPVALQRVEKEWNPHYQIFEEF